MCSSVMSSLSETKEPRMPLVTGFGASITVKKMAAAFIELDTAVIGTETALICASIIMTDMRTLQMVNL